MTYKVKHLNGEPVNGSFYEPELQKTTHDVLHREGDTEKGSTSVRQMERISQYIQQLGGQPHHLWMSSTMVSHNCSYSTTVFSLMGAHCWACSGVHIRVNILDRMKSNLMSFLWWRLYHIISTCQVLITTNLF